MPLQCNIDAKGKAVRLIYGVVLLAAGVLLFFTWAGPAGGWFAWAITLLMILGGGFAIFEARKGWCVVRALGFKTPL